MNKSKLIMHIGIRGCYTSMKRKWYTYTWYGIDVPQNMSRNYTIYSIELSSVGEWPHTSRVVSPADASTLHGLPLSAWVSSHTPETCSHLKWCLWRAYSVAWCVSVHHEWTGESCRGSLACALCFLRTEWAAIQDGWITNTRLSVVIGYR